MKFNERIRPFVLLGDRGAFRENLSRYTAICLFLQQRGIVGFRLGVLGRGDRATVRFPVFSSANHGHGLPVFFPPNHCHRLPVFLNFVIESFLRHRHRHREREREILNDAWFDDKKLHVLLIFVPPEGRSQGLEKTTVFIWRV